MLQSESSFLYFVTPIKEQPAVCNEHFILRPGSSNSRSYWCRSCISCNFWLLSIDLQLSDRRIILWIGINDQSDKVKQYISNEFLNSWLDCYHQDIIAMLKSCRIDGDDNDVQLTNELQKFMLNSFYFKYVLCARHPVLLIQGVARRKTLIDMRMSGKRSLQLHGAKRVA